jgi:hypothetical protein
VKETTPKLPADDDRERRALKSAVMASLRSDNGSHLLCMRSDKRHVRAVARHERKIQDAFDAALKAFEEDPTKTAALEATSLGCEMLIERWREALNGLQEADPNQPLPPDVFAQIAGLLGLRAQVNDYGPAWKAFQSTYGGMVSLDERHAMITLMEGRIAEYEEKGEEVGEKENEALEEALARAHADDTPTGRRLRADVDKADRQMKSFFAVLDKFRDARQREARQRDRAAATDPATSNKRHVAALQGVISLMRPEAGPKTENGPVLATQTPETRTVVAAATSANPAHGAIWPVVSQSTQGPQSGQLIYSTKYGPVHTPRENSHRSDPDDVRAELRGMGHKNMADKKRKRHRR